MNTSPLIPAMAIAAVILSGCMTESKQLESVNKDWNRLIRASHIYPIYPLSEDLEPGDLFFVSAEIEDLAPWSTPGYIKLDHQVGRLTPKNYSRFYDNSFGTGNNPLPRFWIKDNSWSNAPLAGFPSYSFAVKQGGGANVSLPIQGIPVGLALMGAKSASGHVTIADAHTYGVDEFTLQDQVEQFVVENRTNLLELIEAQNTPDKPYYLQVVSRVYLTQKVVVSMIHDSAFGATASGGVPKDVPVPSLENANASANFTNMVNAVNGIVSAHSSAVTAAGALAPGGTIKFTAVSSRSVSMEETFPRPLVIGYTGFNVVLKKAQLQKLVATQAAKTGERIKLERVSNARLIKQMKTSR
jgi:hypothetical protein